MTHKTQEIIGVCFVVILIIFSISYSRSVREKESPQVSSKINSAHEIRYDKGEVDKSEALDNGFPDSGPRD